MFEQAVCEIEKINLEDVATVEKLQAHKVAVAGNRDFTAAYQQISRCRMHQSTAMPMCVALVGALTMSMQMWRCVCAGSATMGCVVIGVRSIPVVTESHRN